MDVSVGYSEGMCLWEKCRQDNPAFAHTRLSNDPPLAVGGWMADVHRLSTTLRIPPWQPEPGASAASLKSSLARYRKEVVLPLVLAASGATPPNPALPWAWIVLNADTAFPAASFGHWWQLRVLGQWYPQSE